MYAPESASLTSTAPPRTAADVRVGENARVPGYTVNEDTVRQARPQRKQPAGTLSLDPRGRGECGARAESCDAPTRASR
jgi:hypothetical protein